MAELVGTYADLPLGAVDASVVAVAERLGATTLATLDRRHFTVVRPRHTTAFALLPEHGVASRPSIPPVGAPVGASVQLGRLTRHHSTVSRNLYQDEQRLVTKNCWTMCVEARPDIPTRCPRLSWLFLVVAGVWAPVALVEAAAASASSAASPHAPMIVFGGGDGVYVADSDGQHFRQIVATANSFPSDPTWSPDGKKIVYVDSVPGSAGRRYEIYTVSAEGHDPRRLTSQGSNTSPSWSPSGEEIAFSGTDAIYTVRPDGSAPRRVTPLGMNGRPVWSPNGRTIAFGWLGHGTYVVRLPGRIVTRVSSQPYPWVRWSPDSRYVAVANVPGYLCRSACSSAIYVVDTLKRVTTRVTRGLDAGDPALRRKPYRLAFVGKRKANGKSSIYILDNKGKMRRVGPLWISASEPSWSPDGLRLAYVAVRPCASGTCPSIFTMRGDGRDLTPISHYVDPQGYSFAWRP